MMPAKTEIEKELLGKQLIKSRVLATTLWEFNTNITLSYWAAGDEKLVISWRIVNTVVGEVLLASTVKGLCFLGFTNKNRTFAINDMKRRFAANPFAEEESEWQMAAVAFIDNPHKNIAVHLHLKGTVFQLNVWKKLSLIPFGGVTTYSILAQNIRNARATGTAVGANPVSYILPCHRAVRSDGSFDRYYWGNNVKRELLAYENGIANKLNNSAI